MKIENKIGIALMSILFIILGCDIDDFEGIEDEEIAEEEIAEEETWVFLMAGQSNMAGRASIESQDTITNPRVLAIDSTGQVILAQEPIHFDEPTAAGLDCGLSFGKFIASNTPDNVSVLLIPTAIGGSSIRQWIDDETHRDVQLLTNFREKVELGKTLGEIRGVLWHQGESDAFTTGILAYNERLESLFSTFRDFIDNPSVPILIGELGSFSPNDENWQAINAVIRDYSLNDSNSRVISTADLEHRGDSLHFNSAGQRAMGERFAFEVLDMMEN